MINHVYNVKTKWKGVFQTSMVVKCFRVKNETLFVNSVTSLMIIEEH